MKVNVLHEGDRVLNVTNEFVAVERVSGEVDILPLIKEECGLIRNTSSPLDMETTRFKLRPKMVSRS